jgi:hypothetical protein
MLAMALKGAGQEEEADRLLDEVTNWNFNSAGCVARYAFSQSIDYPELRINVSVLKSGTPSKYLSSASS